MDAAIAGLVGGVVGAGVSLLGLWLQQLAGYVIFNSRLLDEFAKGSITPAQIKLLTDEKKVVLAAYPGTPKT